jgi:peptidyl-prolyl cis-trans isomerase A (cyclophilin A)
VNLLVIFSLIAWCGMARAGTLVQFRTIFGDIEVELFDQQKPVTVENFKHYITSGNFDGTFFHRWDPGFVLQGGGYRVPANLRNSTNIFIMATFPPIINETETNGLISNTFGTISMARNSNLNSASSQFFFNLRDNTALDGGTNGGYAVFGRTISGFDVLNRFVTTGNGVYEHNLGTPLNELPTTTATVSGRIDPALLNSLIYADITLLNVHVTRLRTIQEISWNSATGLVNRVEFTTNFPPQWQLLAATNGTGNVMQVRDQSSSGEFRFYRVTVQRP